MRRALACLAVLFLLAVSTLQAAPAPAAKGWLRSLAEAKQAASRGDKLIFVDLYADWCGWCKRLDAQVFSTPQFQELASRLVLLRLDVEDGADGSRMQSRFEAASLPTSLVLDADLNLAGRVDGFLPADAYVRTVRGLLAEYQALLARYERVRAGSDPSALHALAKELYARHDGARAAEIYGKLITVAKAKPAELGRLQYHLADSLRQSGDFARAADLAGQAGSVAATRGDRELVEACDLLRFRIAQDRGDCKTAIAALESFVKSHPDSENFSYARRTLRSLQQPGSACS